MPKPPNKPLPKGFCTAVITPTSEDMESAQLDPRVALSAIVPELLGEPQYYYQEVAGCGSEARPYLASLGFNKRRSPDYLSLTPVEL